MINSLTKKLPEFVCRLVKTTFIYLTFMICATYFTAWWIYDMPIDKFHPVFVIMYTLINTLVQLPALGIRLTMEAPADLSHSQILMDVWVLYIECYPKYMISCGVAMAATFCYTVWLLKVSISYRSSQCLISRWLAYIILGLYVLTFVVLLIYVIIPFFWEVYNQGWATAMLKALWRLGVWLVPNPKAPSPPDNSAYDRKAHNADTANNKKSGFANHNSNFNQHNHKTENGRVYSPEERSWVGYFKGEQKPEKPKPKPLSPMSPRQAMFETRQIDKVLDSRTEEQCSKAQKEVVNAMQKGNAEKIAEALGKLRMCKTIQDYQKEAAYQKTEIAAATSYGRENPTNITEAWHNMLGVVSEQTGTKLGDAGARAAYHVAKHGMGPMADVIFDPKKTLNSDGPETPKSPRNWDEVV